MPAISKLREAIDRERIAAQARMNVARLKDRQTDELIGIVRMALADGALDAFEAEFMLRWLEANEHARRTWPGKVIHERLCLALADNDLSADEEAELLDLLVQSIGAPEPDTQVSSKLPLTAPLPAVVHAQRRFCFTGRFFGGSRTWCMEQTAALGGIVTDRLTSEVDYLVIGEAGSQDWVHSTHGRKIEAALAFREKGSNIVIISEEHWAASL